MQLFFSARNSVFYVYENHSNYLVEFMNDTTLCFF